MKKNFAINAAKQLLSSPVIAAAAKTETTDYLRLSGGGKKEDPVCCPWLAYFTKPQHEQELTLSI